MRHTLLWRRTMNPFWAGERELCQGEIIRPYDNWSSQSLKHSNRSLTMKGTTADILRITEAVFWAALMFAANASFGEVVGWNTSGAASDVPDGLTNVVAIAAGDSHTLAVRVDGTVVAWGDDSWGQIDVPSGLASVKAVAGGNEHSLALLADGTLVAWGGNDSGQTNIPPGLTNVVAIAAASGVSLALNGDGTVSVWGDNSYGQTNVPPGLDDVVSIGAGPWHCLAVRANGTIVAWGNTNLYNAPTQSYIPAGLNDVTAVAGGYHHSLALRSDGTVVAMGQYGNGWYGFTPATVPTGLKNVVAISAAGDLDLALQRDGSVVAWGRSGVQPAPFGLKKAIAIALGLNTYNLALMGEGKPFLTSSVFGRSVAYGGSTYLRVSATGAWPLQYQWQFNGTSIAGATNPVLTLSQVTYQNAGSYSVLVSNQFGTITNGANVAVIPLTIASQPQSQSTFLGDTIRFQVGAEAQGPFSYQWRFNGTNLAGAVRSDLVLTNVQLDQAGNYSVAVSNSLGGTRSLDASLLIGLVAAWGDNSSGQTNLPPGLQDIVAVAAGDTHCLALKADGTVVAWGANWAGQATVPAGLNHVVGIAAASSSSLALSSDGTVIAWGDYGNATTNVPNFVKDVLAISASSSHYLALKRDGVVVAWGDNSQGQSTVPAGLSNVVAVAAGAYHSLVLRADGSVVAWGAGKVNSNSGYDFGQSLPPAGLTNAVSIAAGYNFSLASTADGRVVAWGYNGDGETGVPRALANVVGVAAGGNHGLALKADGTVVSWGANWSAQTNVPRALGQAVSIAAGSGFSLGLVGSGRPFVTPYTINRFVAAGESAFLRAPVIGASPLSYAWQFNGTNLPGATNAVLALSQVQFSQAGIYAVTVSNVYGTTLIGMHLGVGSLLLTTQPQSQAPVLGSTAVLQVGAAGLGPFTYQWRFNGLNLIGETNAMLVLSAVQLSQSGSYDVVVSNGLQSMTSVPASLSVTMVAQWEYYGGTTPGLPPNLTNVVSISQSDSHGLALKADGTVAAWGDNWAGQTNVPTDLADIVAVAAGGVHSLALKANGTVVAWGGYYYSQGPTNVPADLSGVVAIATGSLHSMALRADGTVVAWGDNSAGQTNVPAGLNNVVAIACGPNHSLALRADGTVAAWGANGYNPSPAIVPSDLSRVVAIAAGVNHSVALRADGTVASWGAQYATNLPVSFNSAVGIAAGQDWSAVLSVDGTVANSRQPTPPPSIAFGPIAAISGGGSHFSGLLAAGPPYLEDPLVDRTVTYGATAFINAPAAGARPLSYQWLLNGTNIPSATNALLTLSNISYEQQGRYSIVVSNAFGQILSRQMTLSVAPLAVAAQPSDLVTFLGGNITFNVAAAGQAPFSYQWQMNGTNLPGAFSNTMTLTNVQLNQAGSYQVVVSNSVAAVTSQEATLSVGLVAAWGDNNSGESSVPAGLTNTMAIACGPQQSLAAAADGTVIAWGGQNSLPSIPYGLSNVVALAGGQNFDLALKVDGTITGWGYNSASIVPSSLNNVIGIAAAAYHSLALQADGTVAAWGENYSGQTNVPAGLSGVIAIAAGNNFSVALRADGRVVAWGDNSDGQTNVPPYVANVVAVAAGDYHILALRADGTVVAWGANYSRQASVPFGLNNVVAIAAGSVHSLALKADGTVVGWGDNSARQWILPPGLRNVSAIAANGNHSMALIGNGPPTVPAFVNRNVAYGGTIFLHVAPGGSRPLGYQWLFDGSPILGATNSVLVLTNLLLSQAGNYSVVVSNAFGQVTSGPLSLDVNWLMLTDQPHDASIFKGGSASFGVTAQGYGPSFYQWQLNGTDIDGATTQTLVITNAQFDQSGNYAVVLSNFLGTLRSQDARLSVGLVAAWGNNDSHQTNVPPDLTNVVGVAGGQSHCLAFNRDGTVLAWGANDNQQSTVPGGLGNVVAVAAGAYHSLALGADGTVSAWGASGNGQTAVPPDLTNAVAIACGDNHSLALRVDGTVTAWGDNSAMQTNVPVGLDNVVAIAAGGSFSLALRGDGTILGWGDTGSSQLKVPSTLTNAVALAAGSQHALALTANGTVVGWGANWAGQANPQPGLKNVVAIAAGAQHSLALLADGSVAIWGDSSYNQRRLPTGLKNVAAISSASSANYSLAVVGDGPPILTMPLLDRTVAFDTPAYLNANAVGTGLTYQWHFEGTDIPGATNSLLQITNMLFSEEGAYSVTVSNAFGQVTSREAFLDVSWLLIAYQPADVSTYLGKNVTLSVTAEGYGLNYQWQLYGVDLTGATNRTLVLTNAQVAQSGTYSVVVSNFLGIVHSRPAQLSVGLVGVWGDNSYGQTNLPPGLTNVTTVASGGNHCLALNRDGTVSAWGADYARQAEVPAGLGNIVAIAAGQDRTLAVGADGTVTAWGQYGSAQGNVPSGLYDVVAVACGVNHNLALTSDGSVVAWGDNSYGQISVPANVSNAVAVAAGAYHSVALRADGLVVTWGSFWDPNSGRYLPMTPPPGLTDIIGIASSTHHVLALRANGTVVAWGSNNSGERVVPFGVTGIVQLAANDNLSVALKSDGTLLLWGDTSMSQTLRAASLRNVAAVAGGGYSELLVLLGSGPPVSVASPTEITLSPGTFALSIPTQGGKVYSLEYRDSLEIGAWSALPLRAGNGGSLTLTDPNAGNTQRFYRVRRW
jgi:alpha-tubulin suppressor-like RCC1 family protein